MTAIFGGRRASNKDRVLWDGSKSLSDFEVTSCGKFALFRYHGKKAIDEQQLLGDIERHSLTYRGLTLEETAEFQEIKLPNVGDMVIVGLHSDGDYVYSLWFGASRWLDDFKPNESSFQPGTWFVMAVKDIRRVWVRGG